MVTLGLLAMVVFRRLRASGALFVTRAFSLLFVTRASSLHGLALEAVAVEPVAIPAAGTSPVLRTGGIDVNICEAPASGGACVRPTVFDIDLYDSTAGPGTLNRTAVDAIHAIGARAIYVDAGSIETYRPDTSGSFGSIAGAAAA